MMSPAPEARSGGRAAGFDRRRQHARGDGQRERVRTLRGTGTVCPVTPMALRRTRPSLRSAEATKRAVLLRHGERQALRRHDDRGVDADDSAGGGHQRPARVAGIERSVGLNDVFDEPSGATAQRPAERADHAARHRVLETVRVADGDDDLAWLEPATNRQARGTAPRRCHRVRFAAPPDRYRDRRRPDRRRAVRPSSSVTLAAAAP